MPKFRELLQRQCCEVLKCFNCVKPSICHISRAGRGTGLLHGMSWQQQKGASACVSGVGSQGARAARFSCEPLLTSAHNTKPYAMRMDRRPSAPNAHLPSK